MMRLVCALSAMLLALSANAEKVLVDPARHAASWRTENGGEFPGATSEMAEAQDEERGRSLEGRFRFAGESRYAGIKWVGAARQATAVGFWVKLLDRDGGMLRILDDTGQQHLGGFSAARGKWVNVEVPLAPERFPNHWSGANDGRFHFPIRAVLIAVGRGPDEGLLRVSDLYVVRDGVEPADRWQVTIQPGVPSGVAVRGEKAEYTVRVVNRLTRPAECEAVAETQSLDGPSREVGRWQIVLKGWQERTVTVRLRTKSPGYRRLRVRLTDAEVGDVPDTISGLAVVPRARHYGERAPDCYFGLQFIRDMEAAERLGAKAIRTAPGWRWAEPREGDPYAREYLDRAVAAAAEHKMVILATLQARAPSWVAWEVEGRPKLQSLPDPSKLQHWTRFCARAVEVFDGRATVIEVQNEPDLTCWVHPGLSFEEGVDYYVKLLQAAHDGIRSVDKDIPIAGLDVSGGDFRAGLRFTRAVLAKAAPLLDLYTGHPYASPRYFGPGQKPVWPIQNRMAEKCAEALDAFEQHGRPRRMWIGELGWGLQKTADPLSDYSLDFAACIARSLIVGKSVPGVEKNLYFTMQGCDEQGYEYGLVRGSPAYPLPAALAYAATAYVLDGAQPIELKRASAQMWRASFACPERNELIVAWWSEGDPARIRPAKSAPRGRWIDGFCRRQSGGRVEAGRIPVYWVLPLDRVGERPGLLDRVRIEAAHPVAAQRRIRQSAKRPPA